MKFLGFIWHSYLQLKTTARGHSEKQTQGSCSQPSAERRLASLSYTVPCFIFPHSHYDYLVLCYLFIYLWVSLPDKNASSMQAVTL